MSKNKLFIYALLIMVFVPMIAYSQFNQEDYKWDLTDIYVSNSIWANDYEKTIERIERLEIPTKPVRSSKELASILQELIRVRKLSSKVAYFAMLKWEEAIDPSGEEMNLKGKILLEKLDAKIALFNEVFYEIGISQLETWLSEEKELFPYRFFLNIIISQGKYLPSPNVESTLRSLESLSQSSINTYWQVLDTESVWDFYINDNGEKRRLDRNEFRKIRSNDNRDYRNKVAKQYYESLNNLSGLMGQIYFDKIAREYKLAEIRNFENGIDANWFFNTGMPIGGYKVTLEAARKNKKTLQRYARLRAKVLQVDTLTYLDFFITPAELANQEYSFNESMNIALDASKILGSEFEDKMGYTLDQKNWLHLADGPKNSLYHIHPPTGDEHPYLILQYNEDWIRSRALVGGLFSMVSSLPTVGNDGSDILENPVRHIDGIIYTGNLLYNEKKAIRIDDKKARLAFKIQSVEYMRRFFKNSILIELDNKVQNALKEGKIISGEQISEWYLELLRDYYGHDKNATYIPEYLKTDWMTETHVLFMPKFEHHFWAPSIALGAAIIEDKKEGKEKIDNIIFETFPSGKYDSYSTYLEAGINLMSSDSYSSFFRYMNQLLDEIENEL